MISQQLLEKYMAAGLNVIIEGAAGTGKTTMIQEAAKNLGWKMKYYSSSTLDPFSDLIGIPVPNMGRKTIDYFRPRELDSADIVFFDELNRADIMVLNSVFEIIQARSINGEKLDRLKCCVAAVNPVADGYATRDLDIALKDRFDLYLESSPHPYVPYFMSVYGEEYATAGLALYEEYVKAREAASKAGTPITYVSPRRLDKLMGIYRQFRSIDTLQSVIPSTAGFDFEDWEARLNEGLGLRKVSMHSDVNEQVKNVQKFMQSSHFVDNPAYLEEIVLTYNKMKVTRHRLLVPMKKEVAKKMAEHGKNSAAIMTLAPIIRDFDAGDFLTMTREWTVDQVGLAKSLVNGF